MYIFELSILNLHIAPTWYGLSYAIGFIICYTFVKKYFKFRDSSHIDNLLSYIFFGIIIGGRIGYILLYNLSYFIENPVKIIAVWEGGMSFHGGFIGTVFVVYIFSKKYAYKFWEIIDTIAIIVPIALGLGRIGNWINKELPGYENYNGYFPMIINDGKYFPSPLLEMFLEGICLFILMLVYFKSQKKHAPRFFSGLFLIGYSVARIIAEQFRLPDAHIGYIGGTNWVTLGFIYTLPMLGYGLYLLYRAKRL